MIMNSKQLVIHQKSVTGLVIELTALYLRGGCLLFGGGTTVSVSMKDYRYRRSFADLALLRLKQKFFLTASRH
jgi:hypothetical protein